MADKELLDRIVPAAEDVEATPDDELEWTQHREPAKNPAVVRRGPEWINSVSYSLSALALRGRTRHEVVGAISCGWWQPTPQEMQTTFGADG